MPIRHCRVHRHAAIRRTPHAESGGLTINSDTNKMLNTSVSPMPDRSESNAGRACSPTDIVARRLPRDAPVKPAHKPTEASYCVSTRISPLACFRR